MADLLTKTQDKALRFIHREIARCGRPPTLREICGYMGYKAVGSVQDLVKALRVKGFLKRPGEQKARGLALTAKALAMQKIQETSASLSDFLEVPCLGSVPAGDPVEAIEEAKETLQVSRSLFRGRVQKSAKYFALKTDGMSMRDAGIFDGDWLIVRATEEAPVHSVVIARMDGDATCKRLEKCAKRGFYLQPENPDFERIYGDEFEFEIIGKVEALQRSF